ISGDLQFTFNDPTPTFIGGAGGVFAASVDIGDDLIVIGAPADSTNAIEAGQAHLFDTAGNLLHTFDDPQSNLRDNFGSSVAIDGTNVLIGARFDDADGFNVGQAHLFDAITGNLQNTLNEPSVSGGDRFGTSLAIDSDKIVIGSPSFSSTNASVSQVHLFELLIPEPSSVVLMLLASVCLMRRMK
ncbi:MAG: FG-GAP repeat protein, partial [Lacipirellulaceae bacterium]